jgi:hypothetical protein
MHRHEFKSSAVWNKLEMYVCDRDVSCAGCAKRYQGRAQDHVAICRAALTEAEVMLEASEVHVKVAMM